MWKFVNIQTFAKLPALHKMEFHQNPGLHKHLDNCKIPDVRKTPAFHKKNPDFHQNPDLQKIWILVKIQMFAKIQLFLEESRFFIKIQICTKI